ncbi:hypothetical protein SDC9_127555 [bioreactor metagenome]|uniref:Uncharacterized protein n=1 Tax=bioreactor metagenome TaxID=1076179 RepID=A0A645CUG7_9ZZZZ
MAPPLETYPAPARKAFLPRRSAPASAPLPSDRAIESCPLHAAHPQTRPCLRGYRAGKPPHIARQEIPHQGSARYRCCSRGGSAAQKSPRLQERRPARAPPPQPAYKAAVPQSQTPPQAAQSNRASSVRRHTPRAPARAQAQRGTQRQSIQSGQTIREPASRVSSYAAAAVDNFPCYHSIVRRAKIQVRRSHSNGISPGLDEPILGNRMIHRERSPRPIKRAGVFPSSPQLCFSFLPPYGRHNPRRYPTSPETVF